VGQIYNCHCDFNSIWSHGLVCTNKHMS
jgi:hypothetical protein